MKQDNKIKRKFPKLYRISPRLYNFGYNNIMPILKTSVFIIKNYKNIRYVRVSNTIKREYEQELKKLRTLIENGILQYPKDWGVSEKSGLIIYNIIRSLKPNAILETGVANGFSTRIILCALNKNAKGSLISTEISKNVGILLNDLDKSRWHLIVDNPKKNLVRAVGQVEKIDIFIHDSDHSYKNMSFEFNFVIGRMSKNGIIMSDDVNSNNSFLEFAERINRVPLFYPSFKKVFGLVNI